MSRALGPDLTGAGGRRLRRHRPRARHASAAWPASAASSPAPSPSTPAPARPAPASWRPPPGSCTPPGWHNPGLDQFLATELPWLAAHQVRTFVSIAAGSLGEYADLARRLGRSPGVAGIEVNLAATRRAGRWDCSTPGSRSRRLGWWPRSAATCRAASRCWPSSATTPPASSRPRVPSPRAGADAVVLGNALPALMPDGRPGGLSGPAILPVALRCVADVRSALPDLTVVGAGGAACAADVRAFLDAGAVAVQIGAALLHDPTTAARTAADLGGIAMTEFGARLRAAMDQRGPLCPGIDPHPALLHAWDLEDTPAGLEHFAMTAVDALAPVSSSLKPQSAFFERHGSRGIAILERVVAEARAAGALVILDVKRGDIGSTAQGYADAYLDPSSPLAVDAMTVSPFLGFASRRAAGRDRPAPRRRTVRAGPDLQPGSRPGAARAPPATAPSPARCWPSSPRSTPEPTRSAPSAPWSAPPSAARTRTSPSTARCWRPASAPRVARRRRWPRSSATSCATSCPPPPARSSPPARVRRAARGRPPHQRRLPGDHRLMRAVAPRLTGALLAGVLLAGAAGCSETAEDRREAYCAQVKKDADELSTASPRAGRARS